MEFVETKLFTKLVGDYLPDAEYRRLQVRLAGNPEAGKVIQGTGGIRKLRWRDSGRKKGSRGGLRVIYYVLREDRQIWMLTLYDKDEAADLTRDERRVLGQLVAEEVRARRQVRWRRRKRP